MKGKNLLLLAVVGIALYWLWKRNKASKIASTTPPSTEAAKEAAIAAAISSDTAV